MTKDGTTIYYKDWGPKGTRPIVFHHGWPLSSDDWDAQAPFFLLVYEGLSHGMCTNHPDVINRDLLAFVTGA